MKLPKHFLFLASTGRSGTTIVRRSLGLHSDIYYNGKENNIVQDLLGVAQKNCTARSRQTAMVVDQTEYNEVFRQAIIRLIWPDPKLVERSVWMAAINPTGDLLDYISDVFPKAIFICLVRNPKGMISSRMRYRSFQSLPFESHCQTWMRSESVYRWCLANPDRGFVMRHEWLYSGELPSLLSRLFELISLQNESAVIENIESVVTHPTGESDVSDQGQRKAFFESKNRRWNDWTVEQKESYQHICGEFAEELGY